MTVEHLEVLVEEASAEAALRVLLPRMLGETSFEIYPHHGKSDLLVKLPSKLRAHARWLPENARVAVVVDRDDDDCEELKAKLEKIAKEAGLITRSAAKKKPWVLVNRIAVEELEAWYFGDWPAVRAAYPRASSARPSTTPTSAARVPPSCSCTAWAARTPTGSPWGRSSRSAGGPPTLIVHGQGDRLVDIRASRAVAAANPRFELKELPGVGHVPQLETPEAFVEIALAWLDRRATPRAA